MYDEEAIYQDADIEQFELEQVGNRIAQLDRQGVCTHGHWVGLPDSGEIFYPAQRGLKPGQVRCTDRCKRLFDVEEDLLEDRAALLG